MLLFFFGLLQDCLVHSGGPQVFLTKRALLIATKLNVMRKNELESLLRSGEYFLPAYF